MNTMLWPVILTLLACTCAIVQLANCNEQIGTSYDNISLDSFLVVIGRVSQTTARVLYDALLYQEKIPTISYTLVEYVSSVPGSVVQSGTLHPAGIPEVLILKDLKSCTQYDLHFYIDEILEENLLATAVINTVCPDDNGLKVVAVSCDRYLDDHDDEFVHIIGKNLTGNEIMFHIGDQIYLDLPRKKMEGKSFEEAFQLVRKSYHLAWTRPAMAAILRKSSHIMLPDDHDIFNALSPNMIETHFSDFNFIKAAHLCFLIFQRQLARDVVLDIQGILSGKIADRFVFEYNHVHDWFEENGVGIFLLDVRYHRAFSSEQHLTGKMQLDDFSRMMSQWAVDANIKNILVLTNMPLLYPSTRLADVIATIEKDYYPNHRRYHDDEQSIFEPLFAAAKQKHTIVVVGDLHMAAYSSLCKEKTNEQQAKQCIPVLITSGITRGSEGMQSVIITLFDGVQLAVGFPQLRRDNIVYQLIFHSMELINNFGTISFSNDGQQPVAEVTTREQTYLIMSYHNFMLHIAPYVLITSMTFLFATVVKKLLYYSAK